MVTLMVPTVSGFGVTAVRTGGGVPLAHRRGDVGDKTMHVTNTNQQTAPRPISAIRPTRTFERIEKCPFHVLPAILASSSRLLEGQTDSALGISKSLQSRVVAATLVRQQRRVIFRARLRIDGATT